MDVGEQVREMLAPYRGRKGVLIPVLQTVQTALGYLLTEAMPEIAEAAGVSLNTAYGVASFYAQFRFVKPGKHTVKLCLGTACHVRGAGTIADTLRRELGVAGDGVTEDGMFGLESVRCFGSCALAPVVVVDDEVHGRMTPAKAKQALGEVAQAEKSHEL